jgi:hypothetical protein
MGRLWWNQCILWWNKVIWKQGPVVSLFFVSLFFDWIWNVKETALITVRRFSERHVLTDYVITPGLMSLSVFTSSQVITMYAVVITYTYVLVVTNENTTTVWRELLDSLMPCTQLDTNILSSYQLVNFETFKSTMGFHAIDNSLSSNGLHHSW